MLLHGLVLTWLWTGEAPAPGQPAVALGTGATPLRLIELRTAVESADAARLSRAVAESAAPAAPSASLPEVPTPVAIASMREPAEIDRRPVAERADGTHVLAVLAGRASSPAAGGGDPVGRGSAVEGTGKGGSSGSPEGAFTPPRARSVLHTWSPHRAVMGLEVLVRVRLDERGRPTGIVELLPPTPHQGTNEQLVYWSRNVEYHPALIDGRPVAGWAEVSYRFCYEGTTAASPPSPTFGRPDPCAAEDMPQRPVAGRRSGT